MKSILAGAVATALIAYGAYAMLGGELPGTAVAAWAGGAPPGR